MATLHAEPTPMSGGEAERLTSHRVHCDQARGRWASAAQAGDLFVSLLLGHLVSSAVLLTALAFALAWLMA